MELKEKLQDKIKNVKQEQVHDILFSREIGWQDIIYDLINTEQLDPWDVNIIILTDKYLEQVEKLEEADFFISSKVLLAAALLLRIKSEILLNKYIKSIDEILFGNKDKKKKYELERIELDEQIPELVPKSPMPRFRKVTIQELVESLNKAIITENRRIKKEIINRNALRETGIALPKKNFSIKNKIREIYDRLFSHFKENPSVKKITFDKFIGDDKEERIMSFAPLLHLENQQKVWLDQQKHFDEINLWLKKTYLKEHGDPFANLKLELEEEAKKFKDLDEDQKERLEEINEEFSDPLALEG